MTGGKVSGSIGCGTYENNSPQKLLIRKLLRNVSAEFENVEPYKISNNHCK